MLHCGAAASNGMKKNKKNHISVRFFKPKLEGPPHWRNAIISYAPKLYIGQIFMRKAGHKGGFQKHHLKNETSYIVSGKVLFRYDKGDGKVSEKILKSGYSVHIPPGSVHQVEALTDSVIFEVSTPHFNDRARIEEKYGLKADGEAPPSTTIDEVVFK